MADAIVVDASAWLSVLLKEDGNDLIAAHLIHHHLVAPELIRYEAANGIIYAQKRERKSNKEEPLERLLSSVLDFPIEMIAPETWWEEGVKLAQKYGLTFYDAAYLGAASILKIPLLTLDKKILQALKSEKLEAVL